MDRKRLLSDSYLARSAQFDCRKGGNQVNRRAGRSSGRESTKCGWRSQRAERRVAKWWLQAEQTRYRSNLTSRGLASYLACRAVLAKLAKWGGCVDQQQTGHRTGSANVLWGSDSVTVWGCGSHVQGNSQMNVDQVAWLLTDCRCVWLLSTLNSS